MKQGNPAGAALAAATLARRMEIAGDNAKGILPDTVTFREMLTLPAKECYHLSRVEKRTKV